MKRIYCISGLGADHTVFRKLSIDDYELIPVLWAAPDKRDSLPSYAQKLITQIKDSSPIILGLSFGGMIAVEIAKQIETQKVFIVSSAKSPSELIMPGGGILKWIIRSQLLPARLLTIPTSIALNYFGAETPEEKQMISSVIRKSDGKFMKWALKAMLHWDNTPCPHNIIHIHGTADKIIPAANVHPDYWIQSGSHIMIYNRADEVSKILKDCLNN